jgi:NADP-dependent 3-hydroxy acid dehydrogenase YdfG
MRVVRELSKNGIKISLFSWNNKYLLKFEQGMVEQTFKVSEMEVSDEEDLSAFWSDDFLLTVQKRFDEMHQMLRNQLENL